LADWSHKRHGKANANKLRISSIREF